MTIVARTAITAKNLIRDMAYRKLSTVDISTPHLTVAQRRLAVYDVSAIRPTPDGLLTCAAHVNAVITFATLYSLIAGRQGAATGWSETCNSV